MKRTSPFISCENCLAGFDTADELEFHECILPGGGTVKEARFDVPEPIPPSFCINTPTRGITETFSAYLHRIVSEEVERVMGFDFDSDTEGMSSDEGGDF